MSHFDPSTHPLSKKELTHYTNLWCRQRGIHSRDLETHPRVDDVVALLAWREEMWHKLNRSEQACWAGFWSSIYHKKNKISSKALKKLQTITTQAEHRHLKTIIQRAKIKATRQNPINKSAYDMTAKDAGSTQSVPWD
jgi:hypothetical protein